MGKNNKPVIIAICGKSGTGKDTLANWLMGMLKLKNIPTNIIISDTTRPPRKNEVNHVNYNFLSKDEFNNKIKNKEYFEYSCFNNWFYGTNKSSIVSNSINIGVFNKDGISSLIKHQDSFDIICVYLKCNLIERLIRSYHREHKIKIEYFRRAYTDYYDFKNIKNILKCFSNYLIFDTKHTSIITIVDIIGWKLKMNNFL